MLILRRHVAIALIVSSVSLGLAAPVAAQPVDGIALLLEHLETVLAANDAETFAKLFAPSVSTDVVEAAAADMLSPGVTRAVVRERDRVPLGGAQPGQAHRIVVDVLLEHGKAANVTTFRLDVGRSPTAAGSEGDEDGAWRVLAQTRLSRIERLYRIALDASRQFSIRNLVVTGEDVTVTFTSGFAFVSEIEGGLTGLVLVGPGALRFAPRPKAERGQVRIFCGSETLETPVTAAFVRLNPYQAAARVTLDRLLPRQVDASDLRVAQEVFDTESVKSYGLDLSDLSREAWSVVPGAGDMVIEARTRRYHTLTYASAPGESEDISLFDRAQRRSIAQYASVAKLEARGAYYSEEARLDYAVTEYDIQASYIPTRQWLEARARIRLRMRAYSSTSLTLRLHETLAVRAIVSEEMGRLLSLRVKGQNSILVGLPAPLEEGQRLTLTVVYAGRVPSQTPDREVVLPDAPQVRDLLGRPEAAVAPEPRYIYSNRSWWYPQPGYSQFAVGRIRLTVPAAYDVVATGDPAADGPRREGGGTSDDPAHKTFVFYVGQPVRYLSWVASKMQPVASSVLTLEHPRTDERQETESRNVSSDASDGPEATRTGVRYDGVELNVVANPRQVSRAKGLLDSAAEVLRTYTSLLDDTPYPTLTLTLLDSELPGGHSPAYFAILYQPLPTTRFSWRDDPVYFDTFPQFFLAHELAHQFWGQAVGVKNYHEQWISEGFAQYFAALYAERAQGRSVMRDLLRQMRRSAISTAEEGPISLGFRLGHLRGDRRAFRAVVYNKSAMVLHMLRRLVGDEAFFRALRAFYWDARFRNAGTDDVRRVFEQETGRDLGRFFAKWIDDTGVPALEFRYVVTPRDSAAPEPTTADVGSDGGPVATLIFEQKGEPFDVPVTVTVTYASGDQEEVVIAVTGHRTEQRVHLRGPVRSIDANSDFGALAEVRTVR